MTPVETAMSLLLEGYTLKEAAKAVGFSVKEFESYVERKIGAEALALLREEAKPNVVTIDGNSYPVAFVSAKGQPMALRPSWYTGQKRNPHIPVAHCVFLPTVRVQEPPGHLTQLPPGYCIAHIDGDNKNCSLSNLEMIPIREQLRRAVKRRDGEKP